MRKSIIFFMILIICIMTTQCTRTKRISVLPFQVEWARDIKMPDNSKTPHPEVAGAFSGVTDGYLIIAGGANFPNGYPWEGGNKQWTSDVYAYALESQNPQKWKHFKATLPCPVAYGASVSTSKGILCLGGCNADECFAETYMISMQGDSLNIIPWIPLPMPLANCCVARIENQIYVAGGQTTTKDACSTKIVLSADLTKPENGWHKISNFPGQSRAYAIGTATKENGNYYFLLFSGRSFDQKGNIEILTDGYRYNDENNTWTKLNSTFPIMAATGGTISTEWIVFAGGTNGAYLLEEMDLRKKIAQNTRADSIIYWTNILAKSQKDNIGFDNVIRYYNWKNDSFTYTDYSTFPIPLTTNMVIDNHKIYIPSGEIRPGVRTPFVISGKINNK